MPTRDEAFPSKYLKAIDLSKGPVVLEITDAKQEPLKGFNGESQDKTVLHFAGTRKILPLNKTNWDAVVDVTGRVDSNDWPGHKIELFPTTTEVNGKVHPCVRIRTPMVRPA